MDHDLFLDITAFCPEKYFIHRNVCKQTRVSFADYERYHYKLETSEPYKWWLNKKVKYQEYGPAEENSICWIWHGPDEENSICWMWHRTSGPAIIYKTPQEPIFSDVLGYLVEVSPGDFIQLNLKKDSKEYSHKKVASIWMNKGVITKVVFV